MKFAITVSEMTAAEYAAVTDFLTSMGATPVRTPGPTMYPTNPDGSLKIAAQAQAQAQAPTPQTQPAGTPQPQTPPAAPTAGPDLTKLDSRGVPYHPAHHAKTAGTNKDGSWKRLKGTDPLVVDAYEKQYIGRAPAAQAPTPPVMQPVPTSPAAAQAPTPPVMQPVPPPAAPNVPTWPTAPTPDQVTAQFAPHLASVPTNGQPPVMQPPAPPVPPQAAVTYPEVDYDTFYNLYAQLAQRPGVLTAEIVTGIYQRTGADPQGHAYMTDAAKRAHAYAEFLAIQQRAA